MKTFNDFTGLGCCSYGVTFCPLRSLYLRERSSNIFQIELEGNHWGRSSGSVAEVLWLYGLNCFIWSSINQLEILLKSKGKLIMRLLGHSMESRDRIHPCLTNTNRKSHRGSFLHIHSSIHLCFTIFANNFSTLHGGLWLPHLPILYVVGLSIYEI